jgi:peptide deformylase
MGYVRKILTDNHPTLRKVAKKVDPAEIHDPLFQQLLEDMFATMYDAPGIGLAAPQINISKRIFVYDIPEDRTDEDAERFGPGVIINPKFTMKTGEMESTEGCLSVPGYVGELTRFEEVTCTGLDRHGKKVTVSGTGLFARMLQHEVDHLDGILYVDTAKNIRPAVTEEEQAIAEAALAEGGEMVTAGEAVS